MRQSVHLRCQGTSIVINRYRQPRVGAPAAQATMATTAIEGPKEVTELLTDLNNKYEAVGVCASADLPTTPLHRYSPWDTAQWVGSH